LPPTRVFAVGRGLGGLGNGAKRNAKTDQLRLVRVINVTKETERIEDTEPPPDANILCAPSMGEGSKKLPDIPESENLLLASW
jgi:hypothetical protein